MKKFQMRKLLKEAKRELIKKKHLSTVKFFIEPENPDEPIQLIITSIENDAEKEIIGNIVEASCRDIKPKYLTFIGDVLVHEGPNRPPRNALLVTSESREKSKYLMQPYKIEKNGYVRFFREKWDGNANLCENSRFGGFLANS